MGVRRQLPKAKEVSIVRASIKQRHQKNEKLPDHCSGLPMIDQSKHPLPPTAITETVPLCIPIMCATKDLIMASPQRLCEGNLSDASATRIAAAAHRREAPCMVAKEQGSIGSQMSGETALALPPLCCMTSKHMAAPRVAVAHPVYLKATARRRALKFHCLSDHGSCLLHASHAAVIGLDHDTTAKLAQD